MTGTRQTVGVQSTLPLQGWGTLGKYLTNRSRAVSLYIKWDDCYLLPTVLCEK